MRSSVPAEQLVTIDRSGLRQEAEHRHGKLAHKETETPMARHLKALIRVLPRIPRPFSVERYDLLGMICCQHGLMQ